MLFNDIFYVVVIPLLAAVASGLAVRLYGLGTRTAQRKSFDRELGALQNRIDELHGKLTRTQEQNDSLSHLLRLWQEEWLEPLDKLRERVGAGMSIRIGEQTRNLTAQQIRIIDRMTELVERFEKLDLQILPQICHGLAVMQYVAGRQPKAIDLLRTTIAVEPSNTKARASLGNVYLGRANFAAAEEQFRSLVELRRHSFSGNFGLGAALYGLGRKREAKQALSAAIRIRPEEPKPYCVLARAHLDTGDLASAMENTRVALKLAPDSGENQLLHQQVLIRSGRFDQAIEACRRCLSKKENPGVLYNLSVALALDGDIDMAMDALRRALALDNSLVYRAKDEEAFTPMHKLRQFNDILEGKPGLF